MRMKWPAGPFGMVLFVTVAGCGGPAAVRATPGSPAPATAAAPATPASPTPTEDDAREPRRSDISWNGGGDPFNALVVLKDGRRVAMHYRRGEGLYEQHSDSQAEGWTRPRLIYGTKTEACQGVHLRAFGGTVTAIADFGRYCADGEPPMESIAAVGVGDLSRWDHHLTRSFDGWGRVSSSDGGKTVTFRRNSFTLRWSRDGGFSE
ncbi:hypothetical protein ABGB17_35145 [Sphaerisporangium sp. B11E5]|uniref:hypothetical protein n=1 Tax=Sphaerisporangium sp. B11E5 TaxID=3153563 RepID=UPI00325DFFC6